MEWRKVFGEAMTNVSSTENPAIAFAYKFSGIRTLVDVGGGNGSLQEDVLNHIFGFNLIFQNANCNAEHESVIAIDDDRESILITAYEFLHEIGVAHSREFVPGRYQHRMSVQDLLNANETGIARK